MLLRGVVAMADVLAGDSRHTDGAIACGRDRHQQSMRMKYAARKEKEDELRAQGLLAPKRSRGRPRRDAEDHE